LKGEPQLPIARERPEEEAIRSLHEAGDMRLAAARLLEAYGRELFGFLVARLRDREAASEVFSQFTEDLWRGFEAFRWECTARVWSYTLARHAASRYIDDGRRRGRLETPLSHAGPLSEIADKIRTETSTALRSEARSRLAKLREQLSQEDQLLLILRVNRKLAWREIAQILVGDAAVTDSAALEREASRLRKRFQTAKEELRRLVGDRGADRPSRGG
jgi:RNA polymerase sigma-70 factor (ECF subfamily)